MVCFVCLLLCLLAHWERMIFVDHNLLNFFSCVKKSQYITFLSRLHRLDHVQLPQVTDLFKSLLLRKSGSWHRKPVTKGERRCSLYPFRADCTVPTLPPSLSGTFLQTLPDLVTPLKGHSLSQRSCPPTKGLGTNTDCRSNLAPKHARKHETHPPRVKKEVPSRFKRFWFYLSWRQQHGHL